MLLFCLPVLVVMLGRKEKSPLLDFKEKSFVEKKFSEEPSVKVAGLEEKPLKPSKDLKKRIVYLTEKVKDLEHRLATRGFPEVMREERLSEEERQEIIEISNRQSRLYAELVQLRMLAIDQGVELK